RGAGAGNVVGTLRHDVWNVGQARCRRDSPGRATAWIGTNLPGNRVGIDAQETVISERTHIRDAKDSVVAQPLLDGEIPFLYGGRFGVGLYALRSEDSAGRGRHARGDRHERWQRAGL